ncbi:MAG: hypothetical protein ACLR4Z_06360 [Butyricicoccaceae bacterium]
MKRKRTSVFCVLALLAVLLPVPARADMGPKPSVTIHVKNPPSGSYYLDLLVPGEASDKLFDNQEWNHLSGDADGCRDHNESSDGGTRCRRRRNVAPGYAGWYASADVRRDTEHG